MTTAHARRCQARLFEGRSASAPPIARKRGPPAEAREETRSGNDGPPEHVQSLRCGIRLMFWKLRQRLMECAAARDFGESHPVQRTAPRIDRIDAGDQVETRWSAGAVRTIKRANATETKVRFSTTARPPKYLLTWSRSGGCPSSRGRSFRARSAGQGRRRICAGNSPAANPSRR